MSVTYFNTVTILKGVEIDGDYNNAVDFYQAGATTPAQMQTIFFNSHAGRTFSDVNLLTSSTSILLKLPYDEAMEYNYLIFLNSNTGKKLYFFIKGYSYKDPLTTTFEIELDVLNTYRGKYFLKPSFVERGHVNRWNADGTPKYNTLAESIDIGNIYNTVTETQIVNHSVNDNKIAWLIFVATKNIVSDSLSLPLASQQFATPFYIYTIPFMVKNPQGFTIDGHPILTMADLQYCNFYQDDSIISAYVIPNMNITATFYTNYAMSCNIPYAPINAAEWIPVTDPPTIYFMNNSSLDYFNSVFVPLVETIPSKTAYTSQSNRYYKRETKLLTFPYSFDELNDFKTNPQIYKHEYFNSSTIRVRNEVSLSETPKIETYGLGYNNDSKGYTHGCIDNSVKDIAIATDAYKAYLKTNKASLISGLAVNVAGTAAGIGVAALSGGALAPLAIGGIVSTASNIAGIIGKMQDLKQQDDTVRQNGNNIMFDVVSDRLFPIYFHKEITEEYQQIVCDFWNLYGYPIRRVIQPDYSSRYHFNYIKTVGCNIQGDVPQEHMAKIKMIFNNGVTIWHYRSSFPAFFDYTIENAEMSF